MDFAILQRINDILMHFAKLSSLYCETMYLKMKIHHFLPNLCQILKKLVECECSDYRIKSSLSRQFELLCHPPTEIWMFSKPFNMVDEVQIIMIKPVRRLFFFEDGIPDGCWFSVKNGHRCLAIIKGKVSKLKSKKARLCAKL